MDSVCFSSMEFSPAMTVLAIYQAHKISAVSGIGLLKRGDIHQWLPLNECPISLHPENGPLRFSCALALYVSAIDLNTQQQPRIHSDNPTTGTTLDRKSHALSCAGRLSQPKRQRGKAQRKNEERVFENMHRISATATVPNYYKWCFL